MEEAVGVVLAVFIRFIAILCTELVKLSLALRVLFLLVKLLFKFNVLLHNSKVFIVQ